jgi:hypothetical protein
MGAVPPAGAVPLGGGAPGFGQAAAGFGAAAGGALAAAGGALGAPAGNERMPAKIILGCFLGIIGGYVLLGIGGAVNVGILAAIGGLIAGVSALGNLFFLVKGLIVINKMHHDNKIWMFFGIGFLCSFAFLYLFLFEIPRVIKEAKQQRGLAPTTVNLALYFFIPAYAMALDINQIPDGGPAGMVPGGGFGGPPPGAPPGGFGGPPPGAPPAGGPPPGGFGGPPPGGAPPGGFGGPPQGGPPPGAPPQGWG